jgi:hypothetical protein
MGRRDYVLIAACLRNAPRPNGKAETIDADRASVAAAIALELKLENPRFARERFLTACGVES